jgi:hypothetical protein
MPGARREGAALGVPHSSGIAVVAVALLAAIVLLKVGDRRWATPALVVGIAVLVIATILAVPRFRRRLGAGWPG